MARTIRDIRHICDTIQALQNQTFWLQHQYDSSSSVFCALAVAWEALRFAWYAAHGDFDDAAAKLERVEAAIEWYRDSRGK